MSVAFRGGGLELPDPQAIALASAEAEREAMVLMKAAGAALEVDMRSRIHSRSGNLAASVMTRIRRLPGAAGVRMAVGPNREVGFASRKGPGGASTGKKDVFYKWFVEDGTGVRGPLGRPIRRRGLMPVGSGVRVPSGVGQAPQHIFRDARAAYRANVAPVIDRQVQAIAAAKISAALRRGRR